MKSGGGKAISVAKSIKGSLSVSGVFGGGIRVRSAMIELQHTMGGSQNHTAQDCNDMTETRLPETVIMAQNGITSTSHG